VNDRPGPPEMPLKLAGYSVTLFEQYFGVSLRKIKDPETGQQYIDMAQVCEILGLDVEEERARLLADPVLGEGLAVVELEAASAEAALLSLLDTEPTVEGLHMKVPRPTPVTPFARVRFPRVLIAREWIYFSGFVRPVFSWHINRLPLLVA